MYIVTYLLTNCHLYEGTKLDLVSLIEDASGIPSRVITGQMPASKLSVATRMSWAARRHTTRIEDMSYCLLGLFEVNMPPIYGEGARAFRRLQEEIIKRNNDLTILGCVPTYPSGNNHGILDLLADSPAAFLDSDDIEPFVDDFANFSVTNRGLRLSGDIPLRAVNVTTENATIERRYHVHIGTSWAKYSRLSINPYRHNVGILLRKIGPDLFCRDGLIPLTSSSRNSQQDAGDQEGLTYEEVDMYDFNEIFILLNPELDAVKKASWSFRANAFHVPDHVDFDLNCVVPGIYWDHIDRVFLHPKRYQWTKYAALLIMDFVVRLNGREVHIIVICDYDSKPAPKFYVFEPSSYPNETAMIFQERNEQLGISREDLNAFAGTITAQCSASINLLAGNGVVGTDDAGRWRISVAPKGGAMRSISTIAGQVEVFSLQLRKERIQ